MTEKYDLVCGLEIHLELKTKSKMFCGCKNDPFGAPEPNIYTCPVCLGLPGALPVANAKAIEWTIKLGMFLGCEINLHSKFDRKNYFYPDLPKGYQISQYDLPFCLQGQVETSYGPVRLTRIHLEEDTAKLLHQEVNGKKVTLIDFNRSSVPLVEIVSEPDIHSSAQAVEYAKKIRAAVRLLGIGDADMQKGGLRLEANISLRTMAQMKANTLPQYKVEVKNINSFNYMAGAIDYEIKRQAALLDQGKKIVQETRGYDSERNKTFSQRTKENAADYRYFPDPDLPEIHLRSSWLKKWRQELPLDQDALLLAWQKKFGLEPKYGRTFCDRPETTTWAESLWLSAQKQKIDVNKLANYLVNKKIIYQIGAPVTKILAQFKTLTSVATISDKEIIALVKKVLSAHPTEVERYRAGEKKLLGFFMGELMRTSQKKLSALQVNKILQQNLTA